MNRIPFLPRLLLALLIGVTLGALISEVSFRLLGSGETRPPQRIELVIPPGTAERVARGEGDPSLPAGLTFVAGDTLAVINQDSSAHTLGPLFIPAGATAELSLAQPASLAYSCSFRPSRILDLDVREPLTFGTRLYGMLMTGVPLGLLLMLYTAVAWPIRKS